MKMCLQLLGTPPHSWRCPHGPGHLERQAKGASVAEGTFKKDPWAAGTLSERLEVPCMPEAHSERFFQLEAPLKVPQLFTVYELHDAQLTAIL